MSGTFGMYSRGTRQRAAVDSARQLVLQCLHQWPSPLFYDGVSILPFSTSVHRLQVIESWLKGTDPVHGVRREGNK